jgi:hypothetical protein
MSQGQVDKYLSLFLSKLHFLGLFIDLGEIEIAPN